MIFHTRQLRLGQPTKSSTSRCVTGMLVRVAPPCRCTAGACIALQGTYLAGWTKAGPPCTLLPSGAHLEREG